MLGRSMYSFFLPQKYSLYPLSNFVNQIPKTPFWRSASTKSGPKIYTRTGDAGNSSLFTGQRAGKSELVFEALGNTDELNASIGLAREFCREEKNGLDDHLELIQSLLFDVGACVATPPSSAQPAHLQRLKFSGERISELENLIDQLDLELPPLRQFILPSGGKASSSLHISRAVCRRAERSLVRLKLISESEGPDYPPPFVLKYLNSGGDGNHRLSDFLFVSARYAAMKSDQTEVEYKSIQNEKKS